MTLQTNMVGVKFMQQNHAVIKVSTAIANSYGRKQNLCSRVPTTLSSHP